MKIKFMLCIMLISARISFAQESKLWLSLGAGLANTANTGKEFAMGNGFNVQADAFVPFYRKGGDGSVKGGGFTLGVNISGNYTGIRNPGPNNTDIVNRYQVYGGSVTVTDQSEGKISGSFSGLAGIQARMDWGKFNLSPSINLGYLHFKQKGYTQTGSLNINGQTQQRDLVKSDQQSSNGLVFKPQLKIGYSFARNFSFFISPSMVLGPGIKHTTYYLVPQGGFNDKNTYEASQLAKGTMENSTNTGRYRIMELNAGITISIGKKQPTAKQTQGKTFGEKVASGLQTDGNASAVNDSRKGGMAKPGGAVSSSYAAGKTVTSDTGAGTSQSIPATDFNTTRSNKDNRVSTNTDADSTNTGSIQPDARNSGNSMPGRLSMTPTTTRQTQGKTFGEKVASGLQTNGNARAVNDSSKGGMAKPGGAVSSSYAAGRLSMTPTTTRQTQGKSFGEKVAQGMAASNGDNPLYQGNASSGVNPMYDPNKRAMPGQPIGGIIVKGGKNPGDNYITALSDNNGEVLLNNLETGNYLFQLSPPELPAEKSISEKGLKHVEGAAMAQPGNPIGGIMVKGGKNPGGSFIILTVDNKGQIGFEVLEPGNYKLIIAAPDADQPAMESTNKSKEKIKEKATSGLKDTLKTNV
ncbi:MAG: hypothetical protein J0H29_21660 [Sphingobacteriales bacterium]|nr:hypothetical protein [Sphingobacteriales bacterium]